MYNHSFKQQDRFFNELELNENGNEKSNSSLTFKYNLLFYKKKKNRKIISVVKNQTNFLKLFYKSKLCSKSF